MTTDFLDKCPRCGNIREEYGDADNQDYWYVWCDNIPAGSKTGGNGCGLTTTFAISQAVRRDNEIVSVLEDAPRSHSLYNCKDFPDIIIVWDAPANKTSIQPRGSNWVVVHGILPFDISIKDIQKYLLLA